MSIPRLFAAFGLMLVSGIGHALAAPPSISDVRRTVVDGYGKIDRFSVSCMLGIDEIIDRDPRKCLRTVCLGSVEYRFDRATKRLAIASGVWPELLIHGNKLFVGIWGGSAGSPIYVEVEKSNSVTWGDVDEALRSIRKQCPLALSDRCHFPAFLYPFLDGGADRFFSASTRVLDESDPKDRAVISEAHPATPFIANGTKRRLDPQRLLVCIESQDASSKWTYAFDRKSGALSAASGTDRYEHIFGMPGYDVIVGMTIVTDFNKGEISAECTEVALDLPPNAKVVGISDLRAEILRNTGLPALEAQKVELDKNIQSSKDSESQLLLRIAKFTAEPDKRRDDPEDDQLELIRTRAEKNRYLFAAGELEKLIDEAKPPK